MELSPEEQKRYEEWVASRPPAIKAAIARLPPNQTYQFKDTKKQCYIVAYTEPEEEGGEVTLKVQKTGKGGPMAAMGLGHLDQNQVFGVLLDDLEPVSEPINLN